MKLSVLEERTNVDLKGINDFHQSNSNQLHQLSKKPTSPKRNEMIIIKMMVSI